MRKLDINESIKVEMNTSRTWEIIGPEFLNISDWGRGVVKSWENNSAPKTYENAPAGGRYCQVSGLGKLEERIIHYDNDKREITWSAMGEKIPSFVSGLQNEITVEELDQNSCRITSNLTASLSGVMGFIMGFVLKKNFTKLIKGFLHDWKTFAETGKVSETKKREIEKANL